MGFDLSEHFTVTCRIMGFGEGFSLFECDSIPQWSYNGRRVQKNEDVYIIGGISGRHYKGKLISMIGHINESNQINFVGTNQFADGEMVDLTLDGDLCTLNYLKIESDERIMRENFYVISDVPEFFNEELDDCQPTRLRAVINNIQSFKFDPEKEMIMQIGQDVLGDNIAQVLDYDLNFVMCNCEYISICKKDDNLVGLPVGNDILFLCHIDSANNLGDKYWNTIRPTRNFFEFLYENRAGICFDSFTSIDADGFSTGFFMNAGFCAAILNNMRNPNSDFWAKNILPWYENVADAIDPYELSELLNVMDPVDPEEKMVLDRVTDWGILVKNVDFSFNGIMIPIAEPHVLGNYVSSSYKCPTCGNPYYKTVFYEGNDPELVFNDITGNCIKPARIFTCPACRTYVAVDKGNKLNDNCMKIISARQEPNVYIRWAKYFNDLGGLDAKRKE